MSELFSFPHPVNEKAARTVALGVMTLAVITLVTSEYWLLVPLAYGFIARTLSGPTLSPLGWLASRVIAPRLGDSRPAPGPPKRFAQAIGATLSTAAALCALALGAHGVAVVLLLALIAAAALESFLAYCLGCQLFALLMRAGLIPSDSCAACADIWQRPGMTATGKN